MVVGVVALIVIGPKDLPGLFRTMGEFTGKAKGMAREFSRAMNDAANDAGVNDISKSIKAAANPTSFGMDKIKEATGITAAAAALSPERAAAKEKMDAGMIKADAARKDVDAKAAEVSETKAPVIDPPVVEPTPETPTKPAGDA